MEIYEILIAIVAVAWAIPNAVKVFIFYRDVLNSALILKKAKKLEYLAKRLTSLIELKNDPHVFMIWLGQSIFTVFAMISTTLLFPIIELKPGGEKYSVFVIACIAVVAYIFSLYKVRFIYDLQNFDKVEKRLKEAIAKLES